MARDWAHHIHSWEWTLYQLSYRGQQLKLEGGLIHCLVLIYFMYTVQSGNIGRIRFLMLVHDSFKSLTW